MTKSPTRIFPSCYLSPVNIFMDLVSLSKVFNATGFIIKDLSIFCTISCVSVFITMGTIK